MMKSDWDASPAEPSDGAILLKRAALGIGGGITLIFMAGMMAGYTSVALEHGGPSLVDAGILSAMALLAAIVAYAMWRFWPRGIDEPLAPRVKSARRLFTLAVATSAALGGVLGFANESGSDIFSNGSIDPGFAAFAIALWFIAGPLLTWLWWRKIDEHEAGAYRDGALVAAHGYMFITPAWWLASRAGWLPQQDPIMVLTAVCLLWAGVWFARRYF